jgi:hypothetical protein
MKGSREGISLFFTSFPLVAASTGSEAELWKITSEHTNIMEMSAIATPT